jgi:hypothetical protein
MIRSMSAAIVAGIVLAGAMPALAADQAAAPTTKAACKKQPDMTWDAKTKTCVKK